jgi:hypothetical protein
MKRWGDKNIIGNVPVNDDTRDAVRAEGSRLIGDLLARGLILTKAQGAEGGPVLHDAGHDRRHDPLQLRLAVRVHRELPARRREGALMPTTGPTANLPGRARRSGRAGTVWENARISARSSRRVERQRAADPGRDRRRVAEREKPGVEERAGTFRVQDVHDKWALRVWRFIRARRDGDRTANAFPEFSS